MIVPIFLFLCFADAKPMKVSLMDPIIELGIQSLSGGQYSLDQVVDSSFCFFLSVNCPYCIGAVKQIQVHFADKHCILLFLDDKKSVQEFLKTFPGITHNDVYLILEPSQLKPHAISTFPALLAYKHSKLKAAVHGDFKDNICSLIIRAYEKESKKDTVKK